RFLLALRWLDAWMSWSSVHTEGKFIARCPEIGVMRGGCCHMYSNSFALTQAGRGICQDLVSLMQSLGDLGLTGASQPQLHASEHCSTVDRQPYMCGVAANVL